METKNLKTLSDEELDKVTGGEAYSLPIIKENVACPECGAMCEYSYLDINNEGVMVFTITCKSCSNTFVHEIRFG